MSAPAADAGRTPKAARSASRRGRPPLSSWRGAARDRSSPTARSRNSMLPAITVSRLLKSCATPLVSCPTASSRWLSRSASSARSRSPISRLQVGVGLGQFTGAFGDAELQRLVDRLQRRFGGALFGARPRPRPARARSCARHPVETLLRDVVGGAVLQRLDRDVLAERARAEDEGDVGALLARDPERAHPVEGREHVVGEDEVVPAGDRPRRRRRRGS